MDEPTTGVDADARRILRESLEHLVHVEGIAVVYVSHDPEGFSGLADRVLEVDAGCVRVRTEPSTQSPAAFVDLSVPAR
jgi:ABC-type sulfate/molybdate transport systems ATPase subunit